MAQTSTRTPVKAQETTKPLLRGYSHAVAAVAALAGTVVLMRLAAGDWLKQLSLLVYGATSTVLFTSSALFHIGRWPHRVGAWLRRLDRAGIFLLIAGTYTPIAFNVLTGTQRTGLLLVVWGLALLGAAVVAPFLRTPRPVVIGLYLALGWIAITVIPGLLASRGPMAFSLLALGGLLYTAGALVYTTRRPRLWPTVFGFHELFHLLVIAGAAVFFVFMLLDVIPFARPS
jgi:hemolysin III